MSTEITTVEGGGLAGVAVAIIGALAKVLHFRAQLSSLRARVEVAEARAEQAEAAVRELAEGLGAKISTALAELPQLTQRSPSSSMPSTTALEMMIGERAREVVRAQDAAQDAKIEGLSARVAYVADLLRDALARDRSAS
jgi:hypothetical protein